MRAKIAQTLAGCGEMKGRDEIGPKFGGSNRPNASRLQRNGARSFPKAFRKPFAPRKTMTPNSLIDIIEKIHITGALWGSISLQPASVWAIWAPFGPHGGRLGCSGGPLGVEFAAAGYRLGDFGIFWAPLGVDFAAAG